MRAGQKGGKVFYGWWVVLASGVGLAMHYGPIIVPTFGVFLKPLSQEFGWSRTQISLAFSLSVLAVTAIIPFIGRLVDRFGERKVILPSVLLFGLSVLSLSFLSTYLWHFYMGNGVRRHGLVPASARNVGNSYLDGCGIDDPAGTVPSLGANSSGGVEDRLISL